MALSRRTGARFQASIWPGFVDAMTGLLLVLMFLLTIFMVVQFVLRETISGQETVLDEQATEIEKQETELDALAADVSALASALGLEKDRSASLDERVGELSATLGDALDRQLEQDNQIASFEDQVASLLADRDKALGQIDDLQGERAALVSEQDALQLALAGLRDEVDEQAEAARLAAARRQALDALVADLQRQNAEGQAAQTALNTQVTDLEAQLSEEEKSRILEAAAAEALRNRLQNARAELTAMTLSLEEQRRKAEETLAMLAAAEAASEDLDIQLVAALLARDEAQQTLAANDGNLGDKDAQIASLQDRVAQIEGDLTALREVQSALDQTKAEREAIFAGMSAELNHVQDELKATQKRLAKALAAQEAASVKALDADEVRKQLAAALAAKLAAEQNAGDNLSKAEERAALLAQARDQLAGQSELVTEAQKQQELLNRQVAALRQQLSGLQALLDDSEARDTAADIQLQSLGKNLNIALARAASEERKRRKLEEEKRALLEAENVDLAKYRSEFFGRLRDLLGTQEGVRIVGDRFVFSSEVLFAPGRATLSANGRAEVAKVAGILHNVIGDIPDSIDWVLRVDGHTDDRPLGRGGRFADNWELSQARALSVVRYMINSLGLPPERLSANGFGQYQPVNPADTKEARAQNRRIELKFTEK